MLPSIGLTLSLCLLVISVASAEATAGEPRSGVLDKPLPSSDTPVSLNTEPQPSSITQANTPEQEQEALRTELDKEQKELEKLPRSQLLERAEKGERAAQVTLAEDYAKEAAQLAFSPEAANDALSDALHWYWRAASRGFPGAPSLDQAGVKFYPIRAQRTRL